MANLNNSFLLGYTRHIREELHNPNVDISIDKEHTEKQWHAMVYPDSTTLTAGTNWDDVFDTAVGRALSSKTSGGEFSNSGAVRAMARLIVESLYSNPIEVIGVYRSATWGRLQVSVNGVREEFTSNGEHIVRLNRGKNVIRLGMSDVPYLEYRLNLKEYEKVKIL